MKLDEQSRAWNNLAALCSTHSSEALLQAKIIIRDEYLAMDIVQDSIVKVLENWYMFDDSKPFWPWYKKIITNIAKNLYVKKKREISTQDQEIMNQPHTVFLKENCTNLIAREFWDIVHASLTKRQYQIITHRYLLDMSYEQLAKNFNVGIGTVSRGLNDSHQKLKKVLEKY
ncbi:RNA polymerase sigma factor [Lysinibacillus sp. SGAir0095]|uniref:RNA polymerase sigma factor n=1 Tax=Lysinibacillus sp. SGAir0095 TaxID=2070463 RepID=UPI0010CD0EEC|nr:sigma-70 family RNA polymerase sigma factor [Lysinibacillus sp. SGAir0095]QCR33564.1 hypothetical protein C1N55_16010 [Lysinibacillus sp. SGAir0095]